MRKRISIFHVVVITFFILLVIQLTNYNHQNLVDDFTTAFNDGSKTLQHVIRNRIMKNQLIYPIDFPMNKKQLSKFTKDSKSFKSQELNNPTIFKYDSPVTPLTNKILKSYYHDHKINLFNDLGTIDSDLDQCESKLMNDITIKIDEPKSVDVSMQEILTNLLNNIGTNKYLKELSPFFINELELQLKYNVVDHYWYRMAGSSVWLEQYQAHFMISRIIYSPDGSRNRPVLSFTYGQLFDRNWKELSNTKLVVPTNTLLKGRSANQQTLPSPSEEKHYKILKFPYFLPIPFWHDYDDTEGKNYGPEDPRIILVKNKAGYDEPLIIFNSLNRKLTHFDDDEDDRILLKTEFYRSMFICWPWQFQKGKANTDGFTDKVFDKNYYNKVVELKLKNLPIRKKQKNWTPFISHKAREFDGFDKNINFIYRWSNLEIIKCDILHGTGVCSFTYRLNKNLDTGASVGPLRGGTGLVNVNNLVGPKFSDKFIPENREIWVGFARAHIDDCGCGNNMYRPNLVVITKDILFDERTITNEYNELEYQETPRDVYKISYISSSISFDTPIIGWDLMQPEEVCVGPNIFIPNGISSWVVQETADNEFNDFCTLTFSLSDYTVHKINIKGLLNEILNINKKQIIKEVPNHDKLIGFDNNNLICALKKSTEFCYNYGLEHQKIIGVEHKLIDDFDFDAQELEEFNVDQFQEFQEEDNDIDRYERALYFEKLRKNYGYKVQNDRHRPLLIQSKVPENPIPRSANSPKPFKTPVPRPVKAKLNSTAKGK